MPRNARIDQESVSREEQQTLTPQRPRPLRAFLIASACLVASAYYFSWALSSRPDNFHFLEGRSPLVSGVSPGLSGAAPGIGWEYRVYSWQEDYPQVLAKARKELDAIGYKHKFAYPDDDVWRLGPDHQVNVGPGRSQTRQEGLWGKRKEDPAWVTVVVTTPAADTWVNHVRLALEPNDF